MKTVTLILLLFISIHSSAQNTYRVFKVNGRADHFSYSTKSWNTLKKNTVLKLADSVTIQKKSSATIVESTTGLIFDCPEGSYLVKDIVDANRQRSKSVLLSVNRQIASEVRNNRDGRSKPNVYGATNRGDSEGESYERALSKDIAKGLYTHFRVETSKAEKRNCFHLSVINDSSSTAVINIIAIAKARSQAKVLLSSDDIGGVAVIPGRNQLDWLIVLESPELEYIAFPVSGAFDAGALSRYVIEELTSDK